MTRRDLSLTIALCASLLAHGVLALITFEGAARQLAVIRLAGFPRQSPDVIEIDPPAAIRIGGTEAIGLAPNASPGDESSRAKDAPSDQALLSRDPRGPGRIGDLPSWSLVPQTDGPAVDAAPVPAGSKSIAVLPAPTDAVTPFGAGMTVAAIGAPRLRRPPAPPAPAPAPAVSVPAAPLESPAEAAGAHARSSKPAADPAMMSPSESDAFSTLGGIEFRDGRMESRLGRSFKSVRPRLSFAAQLELMSISSPRMVLKIGIDATGTVTNVDVVRSSGSNLVDQPVKVAMYQWWFEPARRPGGGGGGETFVFPISWH